ncbi:MAG: hypothetical protein SNJ64_05675, partial [Endomicrobiia bacterium]
MNNIISKIENFESMLNSYFDSLFPQEIRNQIFSSDFFDLPCEEVNRISVKLALLSVKIQIETNFVNSKLHFIESLLNKILATLPQEGSSWQERRINAILKTDATKFLENQRIELQSKSDVLNFLAPALSSLC